MILIYVIAFTGCSGSDSDDYDSGGLNIMYEVSTDEAERANITYTNEEGNDVYLSNVDISGSHWTYFLTGEPGLHLSLSAQIINARASIRVTIYADGVEIGSKLSWGQNVSASTSVAL